MEQALTALLASIAGGRRYWIRAPQGTARPYVILQRISTQTPYDYGGPIGMNAVRFQVDIYAGSFPSAKSTADAVEAVLSGYSGGTIQAIFIDSRRDLPAADAGEVTDLFRTSLDFIVHGA